MPQSQQACFCHSVPGIMIILSSLILLPDDRALNHILPGEGGERYFCMIVALLFTQERSLPEPYILLRVLLCLL